MEVVFGRDADEVRDAASFQDFVVQGRARLEGAMAAEGALVRECLEAHREVLALLDGDWPEAWQSSLDDARQQLAWLVHQGFVGLTSAQRLACLPRYLAALRLRLEKLRRGGARDAEKLAQVRPVWERFLARARGHRAQGRSDPALARYRWMVEEYRVSLFAQELGTTERVSRKRLDRQWDQVAP